MQIKILLGILAVLMTIAGAVYRLERVMSAGSKPFTPQQKQVIEKNNFAPGKEKLIP